MRVALCLGYQQAASACIKHEEGNYVASTGGAGKERSILYDYMLLG